MIQLYNTLTKTKERLISRNEKKIQMFVCGPTVFDYIHIGNARTFVFFDIVAKYLRSQKYELDYIQNITDIEDKIITRAKENNRESLEYAKEYYEKFKEDIKALGVDSPKYIPATEHIEQVVNQVKTLIDKGHAYLIEGDGYYFDLSTFKNYGKLSGRKAQMADDAISRIDENSKKKNKGDFCLWKLSKDGEPAWDFKTTKYLGIVGVKGTPGSRSSEISNGSAESGQSELSLPGRPGWHIEDTAITEHYFGPQYDIHGGGQDLIFPHHEAEITQQESASGKKPFVKYWMHVAFLINKDEKMSKSKGNFMTVHELFKKHSKEVLRFYLLSGFYRSPLEYSEAMLKQSHAAINRISEFIQKLDRVDGRDNREADICLHDTKEKFSVAMDNDFNTPEAFGVVFEMIRTLNPLLIENKISKKQSEEIISFLKEINSILGIIPAEQRKIPAEIQELVEKREKIRQDKNYEESDKIRTQIHDLGWEVEDTIYGPLPNKI